MADIDLSKGLKQTLEENQIPDDVYGMEITDIGEPNDKGNISARCKIVESEDEELLGRSQRMVVYNVDTGWSLSGQQLLTQKRWTNVPADENGELSLKNLIGVKFYGRIAPGKGGGRSFLNPVLEADDYEWQNKLLAGEIEDEEPAKKKTGTVRKKR